MKNILSAYINSDVYLEYDITRTDDYGRTLAYVWLDKDTTNYSNMLNYKIVQEGYAINKEFLPNVTYARLFNEACNLAKDNKVGLWTE